MNDQVDDELFELLASTVGPLDLELVDVERRAGLVRVVVDRADGADLDRIAEATRAVSSALDRHDPLPGRYTLEVTSPGVERPLRQPRDFARAVGETVTVRTRTGAEGERRFTGRLAAADTEGFVVESDAIAPKGAVSAAEAEARRFAYDEVERARTVFEWGPAAPARPGRARHARASSCGGGRP